MFTRAQWEINPANQDQKIVIETVLQTITIKNNDHNNPGTYTIHYAPSNERKEVSSVKAQRIANEIVFHGGVVKSC